MKILNRIFLSGSLAIMALSVSNNTLADEQPPITGLPEQFKGTPYIDDLPKTPEFKTYIEMLLKKQAGDSLTGDAFLPVTIKFLNPGGQTDLLSLLHWTDALGTADVSDRLNKHFSDLEAYNRANGFDKRRLKPALNDFLAELPDHNPSILSNLRFFDAPFGVTQGYPFDFDKMSKTVVIKNEGYCKSAKDSVYQPSVNFDREPSYLGITVGKIYSSADFDSYYTKRGDCEMEIAFNDEVYAEAIESAYNEGALYVTNEIALTGNAIGRRIVGVGRNLVFLRRGVKKGTGEYYEYLGHHKDPRTIGEVLATTPLLNSHGSFPIRKASDIPTYMSHFKRANKIFALDQASDPLNPTLVLIKHIDDATFDVVKIVQPTRSNLKYGAYARYNVIEAAGIYYAVKSHAVNNHTDLPDAYALTTSMGLPALYALGSLSEGQYGLVNVKFRKAYDLASWDKIFERITAGASPAPFNIGIQALSSRE